MTIVCYIISQIFNYLTHSGTVQGLLGVYVAEII